MFFSCEPRKSYVLKCTDDDDEMFDEKVEGTQVRNSWLVFLLRGQFFKGQD